jgi:hypothetical protein
MPVRALPSSFDALDCDCSAGLVFVIEAPWLIGAQCVAPIVPPVPTRQVATQRSCLHGVKIEA